MARHKHTDVIIAWAEGAEIHLHGHSHGHANYDNDAVDVGVDCWDYKPISLEQIRERILGRG